jgi:hypothetical protein
MKRCGLHAPNALTGPRLALLGGPVTTMGGRDWAQPVSSVASDSGSMSRRPRTGSRNGRLRRLNPLVRASTRRLILLALRRARQAATAFAVPRVHSLADTRTTARTTRQVIRYAYSKARPPSPRVRRCRLAHGWSAYALSKLNVRPDDRARRTSRGEGEAVHRDLTRFASRSVGHGLRVVREVRNVTRDRVVHPGEAFCLPNSRTGSPK